ncbi:MAG: hypothetical protein AAB390_02190, partial [Patescibacteria group bacterium]
MNFHVIATRLRYASDGQWERSDCVRRSLKGEGGRGNPLQLQSLIRLLGVAERSRVIFNYSPAMKKNLVYIIGGVLVLGVIGAVVYFNDPNQKNEAVAPNDLLTLKVLDERFPPAQLEILKGQFAAAVSAVEKNPDSYNDWITIGIVKKQVNDYEGARAVWEKAAILRPAGSLPLFNLANLYADFLNDPTKAEEYYLAALKNSPDLVQAY